MSNKKNRSHNSRNFRNNMNRSKGGSKTKGNGNANREENVEKQNFAPPPIRAENQQAGPSNNAWPVMAYLQVSPMVSLLKPLTAAGQVGLPPPPQSVEPSLQKYILNCKYYFQSDEYTFDPNMPYQDVPYCTDPNHQQMVQPIYDPPHYLSAWWAILEMNRARMDFGQSGKRKRIFGPVFYEETSGNKPVAITYKQEREKRIKENRWVERNREVANEQRSAEEEMEEARQLLEENERYRREEKEREEEPFFFQDYAVEKPSPRPQYKKFGDSQHKYDISECNGTMFYVRQKSKTTKLDDFSNYLYIVNSLRPPKNFYPNNRKWEMCDSMQNLKVDEDEEMDGEGGMVSFEAIGCLMMRGVGGDSVE